MFNPTSLFCRYLAQLQHWLGVIEHHGGDALLNARLHDDMLPLVNQVRAAANFTLRGSCPLAGRDVISFECDTASYRALRQQLEQTAAYLQKLEFDEAQLPAEIAENAGFNRVSLPPEAFITLYIVPNFFFHLNMVYAIARHHGVPLSKQDYDGFHGYPSGFSFDC
ncbi:MAG TPA: DUF1993 domain-containing protein [Marinagarivorans sp.]